MSLMRLAVAGWMVLGTCASAHEFWIDAEQYQVESGAPVVAHLRNGEVFVGSSLAWLERNFTRFETVMGDMVRPVEGRMGDTPAMQAVAPDREGLLVVLHETTPSTLTYRDWEQFVAFAEHKDARDALEVHAAQGWPQTGFREIYTRHVKALIAVGSGAGADRAFGLATEIVALTNPYLPEFDGTMRVEVLDAGAPRPDVQVEVFARAPDGTVTVSLHRTDASGRGTIPVQPGHEYLLDAVILRPAPATGATENAPLWESLWAALTFAVPAR